ncbi:MAG: lamin tail domain-containing protein, partial [Candidatus Magasanikbacteria bacterium]|nr:lamin tail domain-containing protein [Candidatus Magasanikbacteria bacterium]
MKSSFSLGNDGGVVGLKVGSDGPSWSEINYSASWGGSGNGKSLEKKEETGSNSQDNWQESYVLNGTPGLENSIPLISPIETPTTTPEITPTSTPSVIIDNSSIKINEIYPVTTTSSEKEWVELFNASTSSIDISGWFILDNSSTTTLEGEIAPLGFWVVEFSSRLNNSGDQVVLKDGDEEIIDKVVYGEFNDGNLGDNLVAPEAGQSLARNIDGVATGVNQTDFSLTTTPTKGDNNVIKKPVVIVNYSGGSSGGSINVKKDIKEDAPIVPIVLSSAEKKIIINEVFPNPKGSDTEKEMIELKNISQESINLDGWFLIGSTKRKFSFTSSTILAPGNFLVVDRKQTKISLKNSGGDFLELYNPAKQLADKVVYTEDAGEDLVFIRTTSAAETWAWSLRSTLGAENILVPPNYAPEVFFSLPNVLLIGEEGVFEAGDTFDPDDDNLRFIWNLDGNLLEGENVVFSFNALGKKKITLTVDDNHGHVVVKKTTMLVEGEDAEKTPTVAVLKVNKTKSKVRQNVFLNEVKNLAIGDLVKTTGTIVVLPGLFSTQMFFIVDPLSGAGLPVYMYKKDWPPLAMGDKVEVQGELGSYSGGLRLKLKTKADIDILSIQETNPLELIPTEMAEIDDEKLFSLVKVEGEVVEVGSGFLFLADETGEIQVQLKSRTGLKGKVAQLGDVVSAVGVVGTSKNEKVIWPRGVEDIKILKINPEGDKTQTKEVTEKYLTATAGGLTSLLLALLAKGRGAVAKAVALGFIGRVAFW